jgi:lysine-specific demethylase 8
MKPDNITQQQWRKYNLYFILEHFIGLNNSRKYLKPRKLKLFAEALKNPGFTERAHHINVKDIERHSFDEIKHNRDILLQTPLVFRGAAKNWPAIKKWTKEFFRNNYGNTPVTIIDNPGLVDKEQKNVFVKTTFEGYFKEAEKDRSKYLRFSRVLDNNPVLLQDLDLNWLRQFKSKMSVGDQTFLFIGEGDTKTPMHCALSHTIFIQIKGKKRWIITPPNERFLIDPVAGRYLYFYTNADINNPNDPNFPLIPYVKKYDVVLEEGDVLWLPSYFWHHVENLTPTIGVAFKYQNLVESWRITRVQMLLNFLATKPTIVWSWLYNKIYKQDYTYNTESAKYQ